MNWHARALLRRIALGLPLLVAPGGMLLAQGCIGTSPYGPCPGVSHTSDHAISGEQHDRLFAGTMAIDSAGCRELCLELDTMADSGGADAGTPSGLSGSFQIACALDRAGGDEILTCSYTPFCRGGRAPAGLLAAVTPDASNALGAWLARAAHLERASVDAFDELAIELALHGAPPALVRAATSAAHEERRHARSVGALAARHGAGVPRVRRALSEPRGLRAIAEDNAREGCVREAYAAIEAAHQAARAQDPAVRAVYSRIAQDEAGHALLSAAIGDWSSARLGARAAVSIDEHRRASHGDLVADVANEPTYAERLILGLPDATLASELAVALEA